MACDRPAKYRAVTTSPHATYVAATKSPLDVLDPCAYALGLTLAITPYIVRPAPAKRVSMKGSLKKASVHYNTDPAASIAKCGPKGISVSAKCYSWCVQVPPNAGVGKVLQWSDVGRLQAQDSSMDQDWHKK